MYDLDIVLNSTMSVWANSCLCTLLQLDSATSLITAAKNLMNAVISTVKASYVANTKVDFMNDSQIFPPPTPPKKKNQENLELHFGNTEKQAVFTGYCLQSFHLTGNTQDLPFGVKVNLHETVTLG